MRWKVLPHLRLLVVEDEADEVPVVRGTVALPGQFDPCTAGAVGCKLQDRAFTCREQCYNQTPSKCIWYNVQLQQCKACKSLTAGSVAVVSEVALIKAALDACPLPHLANLGHAQLWVGSEKQLSRLDS